MKIIRPKSKKKKQKKELCAVCKKHWKYKYIKKLTIKKQNKIIYENRITGIDMWQSMHAHIYAHKQ